MEIKGKLLEKLTAAGIEIEEIERDVLVDGVRNSIKSQVAKFPCARNFLNLKFNDDIGEEILLGSDFEHYKFIEDYEAIWSSNLKTIECEITSANRHMSPPNFLYRKLGKIFGVETDYDPEETVRYELDKSESNISISIGNASLEYAILSNLKDRLPRFEFARRKMTMRIENINVSEHDKAKNLLDKLGNSFLFKLDISTNIGLKLAEDREIRRSYFRRKKEFVDFDKSFPAYEYDNEPMSLYWYAKSAIEMPLLQFLSLYQILEFYFPVFSNKSAHNTIKNIIKDPRFNPNRDSDITKIINTLNVNKNQLGFGSELEQLRSTIQDCVTNEELREYIDADSEMVEYFKSKKAKKISLRTINTANKSNDLISEVSDRIYDIRCRVVHTKSSEKSYDILIPSASELKYLIYDIQILEMIVKKVLIATCRIIKL